MNIIVQFMNKNNKDNNDHFEILRQISKKSDLTQRELSKELNFSIGKLNYCLKELQKKGLKITLIDARFAKPVDELLITQLARDHEVFVSVEEGSVGGFSAQVMSFLTKSGALDSGLKYRPIFFPDKFINHGKPDKQNIECGVDSESIAKVVLNALGIVPTSKVSLETA